MTLFSINVFPSKDGHCFLFFSVIKFGQKNVGCISFAARYGWTEMWVVPHLWLDMCLCLLLLLLFLELKFLDYEDCIVFTLLWKCLLKTYWFGPLLRLI